ncbi:MAG: sugar ABC transporter permease, partial [Acidobacteria bacterium]
MKHSWRGWLRSAPQFLIVVAVVAECGIFAILSPSFLAVDNFVNVALQIAIYGILAVGMTLVIITGGIDLSVGSVVALAGVATAGLMEKLAGQASVGVTLAIVLG